MSQEQQQRQSKYNLEQRVYCKLGHGIIKNIRWEDFYKEKEIKKDDTVVVDQQPQLVSQDKKISEQQNQKDPIQKRVCEVDQQQQIQVSDGSQENAKEQQQQQQEQKELLETKVYYEVKANNFGVFFGQEGDLFNEIRVKIKSFFGARKIYCLDLKVEDKLEVIKEKILSQEEAKDLGLTNFRLVRAMGILQELCLQKSVYEHNLTDNSQLLLFVDRIVTFDAKRKADDLVLSNQNLTVTKSKESDFSNVFGNYEISAGRHYWEIKIEQYSSPDSFIFLGIAKKEFKLTESPISLTHFDPNNPLVYGYLPIHQKKTNGDGQLAEYGYKCQKDDRVGVLLEFKNQTASLQFFKNDVKMPIAYTNLNGPFYPVFSLYYKDLAISINPKATLPQNN